MIKRILSLRNIRRTYAAFFLILFILLLWLAGFRRLKGYETPLFLELDPLTAITAFLTSWTVYKGLALSLIIIVGTLFFGRFFCSWVCPLGIINQIVGSIFIKLRAVDSIALNTYRVLYRLKYYILAVLIAVALFGSLQTGLFDPISFVTRSFTVSVFPAVNLSRGWLYMKQPLFNGGTLLGIIFLLVIFANRFLPRFWCRVVCPLGALLGLLSFRPVFRIWRNVDRCTDCKKCLGHCHGGCDPDTALRVTECHVCMNCIEDCPEDAIHYGLPESASSVQMPLDVSRRRLIETAIAGAVLFPIMRSTIASGATAEYRVIRPPGSLAEKDFLRRCIKCGECMKVCPTNAIQPALFEAGFEGLWSPVLIPRIGYCEYNCVLCSRVCPTGAIAPLTIEKKLGRGIGQKPLKIGTAFYDRGRCLPWAMNIDCIVCEEVCPTSPKAIWFQTVDVELRDGQVKRLKRPYMDPDICIGCGICETKCPVRDKAAVRVTSIGETRSTTNRILLKS
ncbi:MAG TPA: 4Fe-4S dicluster domain-containing protein [Thermodesulfovibrionales bacterium]|nr:4Fe-4S dicluster domain-containing protein [Thermodesulfovibrionales bacterium]